jgi:putative membrane protein
VNAGTAADRRVHPATVGLRFLKDLPQTMIGLPALFALMSDTGWLYVVPIAAAGVAFIGLVEWLRWSRFSYGVGAREIVIESGILSRNRRSIPFDRVQDVGIERGPLHRLFGLAKVRIETGGSAKDEGVLDSVTTAEADRLRAAIRAGKAGEASVDAALQAEATGQLVYAMSPGRVFASGFFNFSLVYLAGIFAVLQTFEPWIPFDIKDPGRWIGLVDEETVRSFTPGAWAAVLMVALLLGVITGLLRTLARDYGFRLTVEGARLRRERGLFTRTEMVLPKKRIQLAVIDSGPVRRGLGLAELLFQTLSAGKEGGGRQSVAPFARDDEIERVLAEGGQLARPDPASLQRVSRRHVARAGISGRCITVPADPRPCGFSLAGPAAAPDHSAASGGCGRAAPGPSICALGRNALRARRALASAALDRADTQRAGAPPDPILPATPPRPRDPQHRHGRRTDAEPGANPRPRG